MNEIIEQMKMVYDLMASADFANSVARMHRNTFNRLVSEGFNEDQAMQIVVNMRPGK